jgi:hypothetical protein
MGGSLEEDDGCCRKRVDLEFGTHVTKIEHMWNSGYKILIRIGQSANFVDQYHLKKHAILQIQSRIRDIRVPMMIWMTLQNVCG